MISPPASRCWPIPAQIFEPRTPCGGWTTSRRRRWRRCLAAVAVAVLLLTGRPWMLPCGALFFALLLASLAAQWGLSGLVELAGAGGVQLPLAVLLGFVCPRLPRVAFISYRREGRQGFCGDAHTGSARARLRGVPRVKDIRDGEWWPQLEAGITSTRNFILVLSPGMFAERKKTG